MRTLFAALPVSLLLAGPAAAFEISSPSVSDGKWDNKYIADTAGCTGQNVSVALEWKDPPAGTQSYLLTMYDPDALGNGVGWWHWIVWNIPASATGLPEGAGAKEKNGLPKGAVQGRGDIGQREYLGPCPSPGTGPHRYVFTIYALKTAKLETERGSTNTMKLADAMGVALGSASVTYHYSR